MQQHGALHVEFIAVSEDRRGRGGTHDHAAVGRYRSILRDDTTRCRPLCSRLDDIDEEQWEGGHLLGQIGEISLNLLRERCSDSSPRMQMRIAVTKAMCKSYPTSSLD